MEAIIAQYSSSISNNGGDDDDDDDDEGDEASNSRGKRRPEGRREQGNIDDGDDAGGDGREKTNASSVSGPVPRTRTFPHVEGNYAVHVYVPVSLSSQQAEGAVEVVRRVNAVLEKRTAMSSPSANSQRLLRLNLDRRLESFSSASSSSSATSSSPPPPPPSLHLSLSRCAPLPRGRWQAFLEALRTCLTDEESRFKGRGTSKGDTSRLTSPAALRVVPLRGLAPLVNEQRATTFLALGSERSLRCSSASSSSSSSSSFPPDASAAVAALVRAVDAAAALAGIPPLRDDAEDFVPHVSLAWVSGDEAEAVSTAIGAAAIETTTATTTVTKTTTTVTKTTTTTTTTTTAEPSSPCPSAPVPLLELHVPIDQVVCRVGKREYVVWESRKL